ncbi:MAG: hypothetical protein LBN01_03240 [Endomicrobium sp.]|nr:hypothetical protein [Endomicrobium sp.]
MDNSKYEHKFWFKAIVWIVLLSFIGCANRKPIADIPVVDLTVPVLVPALDTKPFFKCIA